MGGMGGMGPMGPMGEGELRSRRRLLWGMVYGEGGMGGGGRVLHGFWYELCEVRGRLKGGHVGLEDVEAA